MDKQLLLYLDMYNISDPQMYEWPSQILEDNQDIQVLSYYKNWYILKYYKQLICWEIDLEQFLWVWDIYSDKKITYTDQFIEALFEIRQLLESENWKNLLSHKLILIDTFAEKYFNNKCSDNIEHIESKLKALNSYLFIM